MNEEKVPVTINNLEREQKKVLAILVKEYLTPHDAVIYVGKSRTYLAKMLKRYKITKNVNGFLKKSDLDKILSGAPPVEEPIDITFDLKLRKNKEKEEGKVEKKPEPVDRKKIFTTLSANDYLKQLRKK